MGAKELRANLKELAGAQNFKELFRDTVENRYAIPPFQREYAWNVSQVNDLFDDLKDFSQESNRDEVYLLGQIILADAGGPIYFHDLIDGQQRFVSVTLLLLALQHYFQKYSAKGEELEGEPKVKTIIKEVDALLSFTEDSREYRRIDVQDGAKEAYRALVDGHIGPRDTDSSASNMWKNLRHFRQRLQEFKPNEAVNFYEFVVNRIALVRVKLDRGDEAIDFFEKMNDRGLKLSPTDLMKNLLFQKFSADAYKDAQKRWDQSIRDLQKLNSDVPNKMPFLLKALLTKRTPQSISTSKVYREWKTYIVHSQDAQDFFIDVKLATEYLDKVSKGEVPAGQTVEAARFLDSKQFWIPVLATSELSHKVAAQACSFISARTVLSLLAEERSQTFERPISPWAKQIWDLANLKGLTATYEDFLELDLTREVQETAVKLLDLLELQIGQLSYTDDTKRVRLVLALASIELETILKTDLASQPLAVFLNTNVYDIDHVYPSGLVGKSKEALDLDERTDFIGNLALFHNKANRAAGKGLPATKVEAYFDQSLALSKSLAWSENVVSRIIIENSGKISQQVRDPSLLENWDTNSIRSRAISYAKLVRRHLARNLGKV